MLVSLPLFLIVQHMIQEKFNKSEAANQQYILVIEGLLSFL